MLKLQNDTNLFNYKEVYFTLNQENMELVGATVEETGDRRRWMMIHGGDP